MKKIVISVLLAFVIIISGVIYIQSSIDSHSSPDIGLKLSLKSITKNNQQKLQVSIEAEINSTNSLTKFTLNETTYLEGVELVYYGPNYTTASSLCNGSTKYQNYASFESVIHFCISNTKTNFTTVWSEQVFNVSTQKMLNVPAPYGYYFPLVEIIAKGPLTPSIVKVPSGLIHFESGKISLVGKIR